MKKSLPSINPGTVSPKWSVNDENPANYGLIFFLKLLVAVSQLLVNSKLTAIFGSSVAILFRVGIKVISVTSISTLSVYVPLSPCF